MHILYISDNRIFLNLVNISLCQAAFQTFQMCFLEKTYSAALGMLHCSQIYLNIFIECCLHLVISLLCLNLSSMNKSKNYIKF